MFISHRYKIIFIHIQKTGGSSIQHLFEQLDPELVTHLPLDASRNLPKHCFASDIAEVIGWRRFNQYTTFSVVRNPYDRLLSWYLMLELGSFAQGPPDPIRAARLKIHFALINEMKKHANNFAEFVNLPENHASGLFKRFFFNQLDYVSNTQQVVVDHILKLENLAGDFADFIAQQGIDATLAHINKTPHKKADYRGYYNATTQQIVAQRFQRDLEYFNYAF